MKDETKPDLDSGKYDAECQAAFEACEAEGVLLIVCNGKHGHGFSAILRPERAEQVPSVLRDVANQIEEGLKQAQKN